MNRYTKRVVALCMFYAVVMPFGIAACGADNLDVRPAGEERAIEVAQEIVARAAQFHADERGVEVPAVAIDETLLDQLGDPLLEAGFRHVSEQLPSDRAAWLLRPSRFEIAETPPSLFVDVIDLHASGCCRMAGVGLTKDAADAWQVEVVWAGGFGSETAEFREKRLARGAEILR